MMRQASFCGAMQLCHPPSTERYELGCGVIPSQSGSGLEVVAAGGIGREGDAAATVEIYSVENDGWRKGVRATWDTVKETSTILYPCLGLHVSLCMPWPGSTISTVFHSHRLSWRGNLQVGQRPVWRHFPARRRTD